MLKKTITYSTFDGEEVTEDFYFNLSKAEIAEMELGHKGGFQAHLQRIIDSEDGEEIINTFKGILRRSIGRRSEDGRRFVKNDQIWEEFVQSDAYSVLFMDLVTNADAAAAFVRGVMPSDMGEMTGPRRIEDVQLPGGDEDARPLWLREEREPTKKELQEMGPDELRLAFHYRQELQRNKPQA